MPPVVSIVGKSKIGKTTLLEKLVRELKSRGYRIATIKHTHHALGIDEPGKDSWRHLQAGSEATVISSTDKTVLTKPITDEPSLDEIAHLLGESYDIILTEGFKRRDAPKIEVHRKGIAPPFDDAESLVAIATDEPLDTKTRQFSLEDTKGLADMLENDFISPQRERTSLYVNNVPVPLIDFPKEIISNILLAMASSLKGVGDIKTVEIFIQKEPK